MHQVNEILPNPIEEGIYVHSTSSINVITPINDSGSRGPFSSSVFFFVEFRLDIKLSCFFLECLIFLFSLPNFFFICLICFRFEVGGGGYCSIGGSMKVSLPLLGFSW